MPLSDPIPAPFKGVHPAGRIALLYALVAALWIYFSDKLLMLLPDGASPVQLTHLQSIKGLVFVLVTTLLLYGLVRRAVGRLEKSQAQLQRSNGLYQQLIQTAREGVWSVDADAVTTAVNPRVAQMLGYEPGAMIGRPVFEFMDEPAALEAREHFQQRRRGLGAEYAFRFRHREGHDVRTHIVACPVYEAGQFAGELALITDITQQRCYEEALRESHDRFESFMRNLPGIVFMKDAQGRMVYVDGAFEDRFMVSARDWMGKTDPQIWPADTARRLMDNDRLVRLGNTVVQAVETIPHQDGDHHWLVSKFPIRTPDGSTMLGGVGIDITPRRRAEAEILRLNEQLEGRVQQRTAQLRDANEDLETLIYMLSTGLRATLGGMRDFATVLLRDAGEAMSETSKEYAARIIGSAVRMDHQMQDLLDVARARGLPLPLERTCLPLVIHEVLGRIEREHAAVGAVITADRHLPDVLTHRATLSQVLYCLLDNAVKFVAPGVRPNIRIFAQTLPGVARLHIQDNGVGIPPADRRRISEAFDREDPARTHPGRGVGLMIVRKGMSRMKGSSGVESNPEQGSRFWIELPLAPPSDDGR